MTNQLQPVGFGVLVNVFSEVEIATGVENERERVVWSRIYSEESDGVGVRELREHPCLAQEPLRQNVNMWYVEEIGFSPGKYAQCCKFRNICRTSG